VKFVDQTIISVNAGSGGRGCMSFRREAFVPRGGPDGGDGGKGGDVIIQTDPSLMTLLDCQYQQLYRARRGAHGKGANQHGRSGTDCVVRVPVGTEVWDYETGALIADLDKPGSKLLAAKGGRGGRGNARFATSTNRAPRRFQEGEAGQERRLRLELKLIAEVGLVGFPNSGKSTLISSVSNARPKIADYPFTTTVPALGVVRLSGGEGFVIADVPGLIRDAHKGAGMGDRFLRHIERTRILLHLLDPSPELEPSGVERFDVVMAELAAFRYDLVGRPMIVVLTKIDLPEARERAEALEPLLEKRGFSVKKISAVTREGLRELMRETMNLLKKTRSEAVSVELRGD
jgi:GTPase